MAIKLPKGESPKNRSIYEKNWFDDPKRPTKSKYDINPDYPRQPTTSKFEVATRTTAGIIGAGAKQINKIYRNIGNK